MYEWATGTVESGTLIKVAKMEAQTEQCITELTAQYETDSILLS